MRFAAILLAALALLACKDKAKTKPAAQPKSASTTPRPTLETADVEGALPAANLGPKIVINKQEVLLDGEPVVKIAGDAPLVRKDLEALTTRLEGKVAGDEPIALMIDSSMAFYQFAGVFDALHKAGFHKLALLTGNGAKMIPLDTLDGEANGTSRPLVTIKHGHLTLWAGSEKLSYELTDSPTFQPLTRALAELVQSRWPDGHRTDEDRVIIVQVDRGTTAQVLLGALAAVRAEGTLVLFPSIFLAGGA